jgi:DNA-binding response OmpR family regulator
MTQRVLLLEPDIILGHAYKGALKHAGHRVVWCKNGQAALSELDREKPDLVVMELMQAMHNGIEFLYELRSYVDWQDIPVIVISHILPTEQGLTDALRDQLGISTYLYKPRTKLSDLTNAVNQIFVSA